MLQDDVGLPKGTGHRHSEFESKTEQFCWVGPWSIVGFS